MEKNRLEIFSDGVMAIIITIMVLEMKVPHGIELSALQPLISVFISYILSFIYIGIYWSNHHHMFLAVEKVSGGVMWANLHLLFWLSLFPFVTGWMGENHFSMWPVALYGVVLLMAATAYAILARILLKHHEKDSTLAKALGSDAKGIVSIVLYLAGIGLTFISPCFGLIAYATVALIWLIPDRRIEKVLPTV